MDRYNFAINYAANLHNGQYRKGTQIPYITHLMSVSSSVFEYGGNLDQAIAGLLHDSIEDQGAKTNYEEIKSHFGEVVEEIVRACTDSESIPKPPWQERKSQYLRNLKHKPQYIKLVVACDKLHNAQSIVRDVHIHGKTVWNRFNATPTQTLWYYEGILSAISDLNNPVIKTLEKVILDLKALVEV